MQLDLSVLIPTLGGGPRLQRHLPTIVDALSTLNASFEILVVDDGGEKAQLPTILMEGGRIRLVRHRRSFGASAGRNTAASLARGEWFLFFDDDIEVGPRDLEPLWNARDPDSCLVPVAHGLDGELCNAYTLRWHLFDPKWHLESRPVPVVAYPVGLCFLLHRDRYWEAGGFDERIVPNYFEDTAFGLQLARKGVQVRMVEAARVRHCQHSFADTQHLARIRPTLYENRWVLCAVALRGWRRIIALALGGPRVLAESARKRSLGPLIGYVRTLVRLPSLLWSGVLVRDAQEKLEDAEAGP
jgi:GT2 family glycosyltransferase